MRFVMKNVRASFLSIFEPNAFEGGKPNYNGKFIVPRNHPQIADLEAAMKAVAKEKWKGKADTIYENLQKTGKKPEVFFVREPYKNRDGVVYDGFENAFYISALSSKRPTVVDRDRSTLVQSDGKPYNGCYVDVILEIWPQDNSFGRAIRAELKGVQFRRDGDSFGGGGPPASADEFEDLSDQGEDEDVGSLA